MGKKIKHYADDLITLKLNILKFEIEPISYRRKFALAMAFYHDKQRKYWLEKASKK